MKIKKLKIKNYKNLDADLVHNSDLIAFIGNNGSGKSNLLEAISHIFRSLYVPKYKVNFNYSIEYVTSKNNTVIIEKTGKELKYVLDGNDKSSSEISSYLPQKVVAIYSGEETRLYDDCFGPFYLEFVTNINKAQNQGTVYSELPNMLFLNRFYWNISLLCLLISDSPDNKKFVEQVLKITKTDKIKIKIDFIKRNYANYNDNQALRLVRDIDSKSEYTLAEFKKLLNDKFYTPFNVFKYLYLAYTPKDAKIIDGIIIEFSDGLTVSDLSEGEKKLLLIKGALEFAGQEDSIFILDEPDSHIHINNKEQITNSFIDYLHNRQIIITTHSPTLTQCVKDENVYMLNSGKIVDRNKQEIIEEITGEFWNKHQQNSFISSKKPIILLVEGKHDKEHILNAFEKLKDEYPELIFDIFYMNSACNIPPMMTGLRTSEIDYKKIFIGVFDDDQTGNVELSNTSCKFPDVQNSKRHKEGYFAFTYPKHDEHKSAIFTVENFFDSNHLETAFNSALSEFAGKFKGKSIDSISEDVKDKAKSKLFENSKTFTNKEDFKNFRKLFDLVKEIKKYNDDKKVAIALVKPSTTTPATVNPVVPPPIPKISAKENHLKYWTAFKAFVAKQKVSFKLQSPAAQHWTYVSIGSSDFKISILANTQNKSICVQLLCRGKDALNDFKKLKAKYEKDASDNLSPDLEWKENKGKQEHHINLVFADNNPFDTTEWNSQHQLLSDWTEKFYNYFKDKLKEI
jgi:ABC-type cobalamin/Fe3+-siderophores transport system ATPase subunit